MIDFRYHLVSIIAVFLALAIGIVVGSTALQPTVESGLHATENLLRRRIDQVEKNNSTLNHQVSADQAFAQASRARLLGHLLTGQDVVLVTAPGPDGQVVTGLTAALQAAGATVTGTVALQPKFNDLSGTNQSSLSQINGDLAATDLTTLAPAADSQTAYQQQAAQLIASAILDTKAAASAGGLSVADAQTLLSAYAQQGYLTVSGAVTTRATLAVIVTPQTAPTDGPNDPANQVLLALAQQFANASAAAIVVGSTAGSATSGSAISVLRSSSVSSQVSSVDNADTTLGQISSIWALAEQNAGEKPNSYGITGASAVSPVPLPEASATPTITPTPRPTAKGKGTKSVKKK